MRRDVVALRVDVSRRNAVHRDVPGGQFFGKASRQSGNACLGGDDMGAAADPGMGGDPADIDDRTLAMGRKMRNAGLAAKERRAEEAADHLSTAPEIGRGPWRERGCQYVSIWGAAG